MNPREFKNADCIAFDYETTGFYPDQGAKYFAFSLTWVEDGWTEVWRDNGAVRFYFDEKEVGRLKVKPADFHRRLADFWGSPGSAVAHNLKFEYLFTTAAGVKIHPEKHLHDTMIMHQYMDNLCPSHALDYLFNRYHGKVSWIEDADKAVSQAAKVLGSYDKIDEDLMFVYQLADGIRGALLYKTFWPHVQPAAEYYNEIELIKTTVRMEERGFMVDQKQSNQMLAWMKRELDKVQQESLRIVGHEVNLNSEKQVKKLLFEDFGLPRTLTINKKEIGKIDHPIGDCIMRSRAYTKGVAIVQGYLDASKHDGAAHPSIKTNRAGTGRESSENPNLQNVSKEVKAGVKYTVPARRCFRARPGHILLLADYAGIEMRLAVQGTEDPKLAKLCQEDFDFHDACARSFYGVKYIDEPDKGIKKAMRSRAKNARFAMLYGAGLEQTADTLGLSVSDVKAGYDRDEKDFPEFYQLMDKCTSCAKHDGYITTFFGRKLRVPLDRPYAATDYLIQGSAAALFKHAQIRVDKYFNDLNRQNDGDCHIIIPVHDELVMEIRRGLDLTEIARNVRRLMLDQPEITVKLEVEFSISTYTWDKKDEFKPDFSV